MKKPGIVVISALIIIVALLVVGCASGITESDYNQVVSERDQARSQVTSLENQLATATAERDQAKQ